MLRLTAQDTLEFEKIYDRCLKNDYKKNHNGRNGKPYTAPFEAYARIWQPMVDAGLSLVDPATIGYTNGRNGDCIDFAIWRSGIKIPPQLLKQCCEPQAIDDLNLYFPKLAGLEEHCLVLYHCRSVNEALSKNSGRVLHVGVWENNKVISKLGLGPIFRHCPHKVPYTSHTDANEPSADYATFRLYQPAP
jgi:hypothetical protein